MKKGMVWIMVLCFLTGCGNKLEYSENLFYMDTIIQVKIYNEKEEKAKQAISEIKQLYQTYQAIADPYSEESELWYIAQNKTKDPILSISPELYELLEIGLSWYEKSNGLLNIQMGGITSIWNTFRQTHGMLPTKEELEKVNIDIDNIQLLEHYQMKNTRPQIDLGSYVKGYVTELAGNYLESQGISSYLINAGGNVKVGKNKKGYFTIGIASPNHDQSTFYIIKGENISVVTSGSYERFYEYEGTLFHHIIDPNTRYPANHMKSVTVIGEDSGLCDLLSTVLFLTDVESGKEFIKDYDVDVLWYTNDNQIIKSEGFAYE